MHLSNSQDPAERPTILLVEDEDLLREMLEETLVEAGYGVVSAASGEAATNLVSRPPLPRALVTDINLGRARMDGWELARIARQNDPGCVTSTSPAIARIAGPRTACREASSWPNPSRPRNWLRRYRAFSFGAGQPRDRRWMCRAHLT
jgi:CheY-like chemotaxis protein